MAFEAVLAVERPGSKRWMRAMVAISLALHVAALAVGVAYSFWTVDDLPLPAVAVTLVGGAPPPPPPPPPKKHSTGKTKPHIEKPKTLVQPKEHPEEKPKPEEAPEKEKDEEGATDDGQEGGVKGGVAGGVVGGVVGAPLKNAAPKMLNAQTGRALLAINPNVDPYIVHLPPPLQRANVNFSADVYICVSAEGKVTSVKLVRGADPAIDSQIPTVLGRWHYRPYTIDGKPAPFCWPLRYQVSAK